VKKGIFSESGLSKDKELKEIYKAIKNIFGIRPGNIFLYQLACRHRSAAMEVNKGIKISNERMEYLGDAILGSIVAEYLFRRFPFKNEGFLTEMRSKIVNREQLNKLVVKLGMERFIFVGNDQHVTPKNLYGDAFEALVGAIYLDKGYTVCKKTIINHVITIYYDIEDLISQQMNYKSLLLEWSQYAKNKIEFKVSDVSVKSHLRQYEVEVTIDGKPYASAVDFTIKGAEKLAAAKTWTMLEDIVKDFYAQKRKA
jgi:ribonuclease-3